MAGRRVGRITGIVAGAAAGLLLAAAGAAGQESDEERARDPDAVSGSLSLGVGLGPDYEGSDDYRVIPAPSFRLGWRGYGLASRGTGVTLDVFPQEEVVGGPLVNYRFARDDVEDARVDALPEVEGAVELGGFLGVVLPVGEDPRERFSAILSFSQDVSGGHEGYLVSASLSNGFVLTRPLALNLGAGLTYASEAYQESYFGVSAAGAAASGLPAFDPRGGLQDVSLRASLSYSLSRSWSLGPTLIYKRLLEDAADSPVTEEAGSANQFLGFLTATWRF